MARLRYRRRTRIFFAYEGESEDAFGAWLQDLCNENGLSVHLDRPRRMKGGGDPLALVDCAVRLRKMSQSRAGEGHRDSVLLIGTDRLDDGSERSQRARRLAEDEKLHLTRQEPCFEAVLLRLHVSHERDRPSDKATASAQLRRVWPNYRKPVTRYQLQSRFTVFDLQRLAEVDAEIRRLTEILGLPQRK